MIDDHIEGGLGEAERAALLDHLESCADCRADLAALERAVALVEEIPREDPTPGFVPGVMARARAASRPWARVATATWGAFAMAILFAATCVAGWSGVIRPAAAGVAGLAIQAAANSAVLAGALATPAGAAIKVADALAEAAASVAVGGMKSMVLSYAAALAVMVLAGAIGRRKMRPLGPTVVCV